MSTIKLETKYVFHIPEYKRENNQLVRLDMDMLLDDLIGRLNDNGYENLYVSRVTGYYKRRSFDESIVTLYISKDYADKQEQKLPSTLFKEWFQEKNSILKQESFAYEENNTMFVETL